MATDSRNAEILALQGGSYRADPTRGAEAGKVASGGTPGHVRLLVGVEHPDDILADLDQAPVAPAPERASAA
ncbi:MAG: hypothetical protein U1E62_15360 [Alsobacter sp.]